MKSYQFKQCTVGMLEDMFNILEMPHSVVLNDWFKIGKSVKITSAERNNLLNSQELLKTNLLGWNEQELALNFIGPILSFVRFTSVELKFNLFAERLLNQILITTNQEEVQLSGRPDSLLASGLRDPRVPFFSFHEHKPEVDGDGDPVGQVLAAMLAGQAQNPDPSLPIYGCYVIGQNWYFLVLDGKNYTIASPFAATNKEVFDIFKALKALKIIISQRMLP
jgi:hypothetical protein